MEFLLFRIRTEKKLKKTTKEQQEKINVANRELASEGMIINTVFDENNNEIVGTRPTGR